MRDGEIAVRLLDQQHVAEVARVAQKGELVVVAALAFDLAGEVQPELRLADQVERDVGERDVFLQRRRMPAPFGQAMPEDQALSPRPQRRYSNRRQSRRCASAITCAPLLPASSKKVGWR